MYFEDLSRYGYFASSRDMKCVGWLDRNHSFATKAPSEELLDKIWNLCRYSFVQARGSHGCEFCSDGGWQLRAGESLLLASAEIRVFGERDEIFAAPTLIYHYIEKHHYEPPALCLNAVFDGPQPPDEAYFDRARMAGLEWRNTSAPEFRPLRYRHHPSHSEFRNATMAHLARLQAEGLID